MPLTSQEIQDLDFALCEATLGCVEFDQRHRTFAASFHVLWLPEKGPGSGHLRLWFRFEDVGRLAVSLRAGRWNDRRAPIIPVELDELTSIVERFRLPIYGDQFFDIHEKELRRWGRCLSLDWERSEPGGRSHSMLLFQAAKQHLDMLVWFDDLRIYDSDDEEVSISWLACGAKRWWSAFGRDDPRTIGFGIHRLPG